jgi:hypothetical protein
MLKGRPFLTLSEALLAGPPGVLGCVDMHLQHVHALIPLFFWPVHANVTVYGNLSGTATATSSGIAANYTAYNPTALKAPPIPDPRPASSFNIQLKNGGMQGLSIPLPDGFFGFSRCQF